MKNIFYTLLSLFCFGQLYAQNDTTMVTVPAGNFTMGCNFSNPDIPCLPNTYPAHTVYLDSFLIDKNMVTYSRYNACISSGNCTDLFAGAGCNAGMPWNNDHPVNCVDFEQAKTFCEWEGKRLPTEAEWEKAARGTDGRMFPWGNDLPNCNLAVMNDQPFVDGVMGPGCGSGTTQPVGSRPAGASPYGALDMSGNLWQWTQDWYSDTYFQNSPTDNPQGPSTGDYKVVKGSDWGMRAAPELISTIRFNYAPLGQGYLIGFRCVKNSPTLNVEENLNDMNGLELFPNPTEGIVNIKSENDIHYVKVMDVNGKLLKEYSETEKSIDLIHINELSKGLYFIQLSSDNNIWKNVKILKK